MKGKESLCPNINGLLPTVPSGFRAFHMLSGSHRQMSISDAHFTNEKTDTTDPGPKASQWKGWASQPAECPFPWPRR